MGAFFIHKKKSEIKILKKLRELNEQNILIVRKDLYIQIGF